MGTCLKCVVPVVLVVVAPATAQDVVEENFLTQFPNILVEMQISAPAEARLKCQADLMAGSMDEDGTFCQSHFVNVCLGEITDAEDVRAQVNCHLADAYYWTELRDAVRRVRPVNWREIIGGAPLSHCDAEANDALRYDCIEDVFQQFDYGATTLMNMREYEEISWNDCQYIQEYYAENTDPEDWREEEGGVNYPSALSELPRAHCASQSAAFVGTIELLTLMIALSPPYDLE